MVQVGSRLLSLSNVFRGGLSVLSTTKCIDAGVKPQKLVVNHPNDIS